MDFKLTSLSFPLSSSLGFFPPILARTAVWTEDGPTRSFAILTTAPFSSDLHCLFKAIIPAAIGRTNPREIQTATAQLLYYTSVERGRKTFQPWRAQYQPNDGHFTFNESIIQISGDICIFCLSLLCGCGRDYWHFAPVCAGRGQSVVLRHTTRAIHSVSDDDDDDHKDPPSISRRKEVGGVGNRKETGLAKNNKTN